MCKQQHSLTRKQQTGLTITMYKYMHVWKKEMNKTNIIGVSLHSYNELLKKKCVYDTNYLTNNL